MYEYNTRIRYSEMNESGRIRLLSLLNYLQDTSTFHSEDSGLTTEYFKKIQRAWFINYWDIYIDQLPKEGQEIIAGTSPHDSKGLFAFRNFWLKDVKSSEYLLRAESIWFMVNTETLRPIRLKDEDVTPFGELKDVLEIETKSRKVLAPPKAEMDELGRIDVQYSMLDTNHHVNNIRYIDIAYQLLIEYGIESRSYFPHHIRVEYKLAAKLGDTLVLHHTKTDDGHIITLSNEDGKDYCVVELE